MPQVCTQTGEVMESLQEAEKALHWYREAVRVADLIAEEDEADAELYRALYR